MINIVLKSAILGLILFSNSAFGVTKTFTADSSSSWHNDDNWSPVGVPVSSDDVVLTQDIEVTSNVTVNDISVTQSTDITGDATVTFVDIEISANKTFTTSRDIIVNQSSTCVCTFNSKSHWTVKHNKSSTTYVLGIVNLGDYSRLLWTGSRSATIEDLNLADFNVVEFSNGTTTFNVAQDWDESCVTAAILRSRLPGNDAKLVFTGTGNTGHYNVYEDVNSTSATMDISNSKKLTVVGNFTGGSTTSSTIVSNASGDFNAAGTWVGGCPPKQLDSVVIKNGHSIAIPAQYYARVNHLYIEGTGKVTGPNASVLEIEENLHVNSDSCFNAFTGLTEFRSTSNSLMINQTGNTIKFNGIVKKDVNGTTLTVLDTVWFESTANRRGDITITRGTVDFGSFNVYLENDLNVGNNGTLIPGTSTWIAKGSSGQITTLDIDGTGHLYNLVTDKLAATDYVELESDIELENNLDLRMGVIQSFSGATLIFRDGATSDSSDVSSFVDGPVQKIGDEAFEFPIGDEVGGTL